MCFCFPFESNACKEIWEVENLLFTVNQQRSSEPPSMLSLKILHQCSHLKLKHESIPVTRVNSSGLELDMRYLP
jgi:hypothetical protein